MPRVLLVFLGATSRQKNWWKTYNKFNPGVNHDLLNVYLDRPTFLKIKNPNGAVIHESKLIDGKDIPNRAFGAYRHFFNKYSSKYDYFVFVSDDVIIRRNNWMLDLLAPYELSPKLGWTATQIFSQESKCFPNHLRAPIWTARTSALIQVDWKFQSDHEGEQLIADQFLAAGFFGLQCGNLFDLAYDSIENGGLGRGDGIVSKFEMKFFPLKFLKRGFSEKEILKWEKRIWKGINSSSIEKFSATSPHSHIGQKNYVHELEGLNGQVYRPSLELAKQEIEVLEIPELNIAVSKSMTNRKLIPSQFSGPAGD